MSEINLVSKSDFVSQTDKIKKAVDDYNARQARTLTDINTQLVAKGSTAASDLSQVPEKVQAIPAREPVYYNYRTIMYQEIMNVPIVTTLLDNYIYSNATNLKEFYAPNIRLTTSPSYAFQDCTSLEKLELNSIGSIGNYFASGCTALKSVLLGYYGTNNYAITGQRAFYNDTHFDTLILTGDKVCTLENVATFQNTPFRNGNGGTVYVPQALISSYEQATNWSALESCTFAAIEGSVYE